MLPEKSLFFIALLPPSEVQKTAHKIKKYFAENYQSKAALKSPPHITLQPPFQWEIPQLPILEATLTKYALSKRSIPIILDGFAAFKPRVIFINVIKTPELLAMQKSLSEALELSLNIRDQRSQNRSFATHLTVAYKDLTRSNFQQAWPEFEHKSLHFEFMVSELTLLIHQERRWQIYKQFSFG